MDYIIKIDKSNFEKPYTIADRNELWRELEKVKAYVSSLSSLWREMVEEVGLGGDYNE